jgi:hypothetical protein
VINESKLISDTSKEVSEQYSKIEKENKDLI